MIDIRTGKSIKDYPILEDPQLYIYIILNEVGKVKIGKSKNIEKRYHSLCGSNGQGNEIVKIYVSECTYLYTMERIMHNKFNRYRIPKTEWFYDKDEPTGKVLFDKAISELELLFSSDGYKKNNLLRKNIYDKRN